MNMTAAEARAIAKEAYIYGFPMVDNLQGLRRDGGAWNGFLQAPPSRLNLLFKKPGAALHAYRALLRWGLGKMWLEAGLSSSHINGNGGRDSVTAAKQDRESNQGHAGAMGFPREPCIWAHR